MNGRAGIYRAQNNHRFAVAKGSMQRRRVSTQQRRDLQCCVPESGQRRRSGIGRYAIVDKKGIP